MISEATVLSPAVSRRRAADFLALTKPRVVVMILITTAVGFYLASAGDLNYLQLAQALIGTGFAAGGTLALNQYLERDADARMERTRLRPLPDGRLDATEALAFGVVLTAGGLLYLTLAVNPVSGLVTAFTAVSYLFAYTPLKRKTPLCSIVGAIPGALPPVTGWTAAGGSLGIEACVLFSILFLWQLPHSLAIAWLYREDYAKAGMALLPVVEPDGRSTSRQIVVNSLALLAVALLPTLLGVSGAVYFAVALVLGAGLAGMSFHLASARTPQAARRLLYATLLYLPALLAVMALDKVTL